MADVKDIKEEAPETLTSLAPTSELIGGLMGTLCRYDADFHARLADNPTKTMQGLLSQEMSALKVPIEGESIHIQTVQNTEDVVHVSLPAYHILDTFQLDDEQLDSVAGGEIFFSIGMAAIFAGVGSLAWATATVSAFGVAIAVGVVAVSIAAGIGAGGAVAGVAAGIAAGAGAI